jgi:trimethylamine-N-oxide reductase cytochrome c-type subunit TorC
MERPGTGASEPDGEILAAAPIRVVAVDGDMLQLELTGWQREGSEENLYAREGKRILIAKLEEKAVAAAKAIRTVTNADTDDIWTEVRITAWAKAGRFIPNLDGLWTYGAEMYDAACSFCHAPHAPARYAANDWIGHMNAMKRFTPLDGEQSRVLQTYLQLHAKDTAGKAQ